jgi:hypothetical protein
MQHGNMFVKFKHVLQKVILGWMRVTQAKVQPHINKLLFR